MIKLVYIQKITMKNIYLLLLFVLFVSCKETEQDRIKRLVSEWQGKEILFPKHFTLTYLGNETIDTCMLPKAAYKILVYVDSAGCTSCKLQLSKWKAFIHQLDTLCKEPVPVLFFLHLKEKNEIGYYLRRDRFDYPVYLDKQDSLNLLNNFPSIEFLRTFLLDGDNKVKAIGDPMQNPGVKAYYLKLLTDAAYLTIPHPKTSVSVDRKHEDFGQFNSQETKEVIFTIKNIGSSPLVISDVNTTCGCTSVEYDKYPVAPDGILSVKIKMKPKGTGRFEEVISVSCNASASPIKLTIKGLAL